MVCDYCGSIVIPGPRLDDDWHVRARMHMQRLDRLHLEGFYAAIPESSRGGINLAVNMPRPPSMAGAGNCTMQDPRSADTQTWTLQHGAYLGLNIRAANIPFIS